MSISVGRNFFIVISFCLLSWCQFSFAYAGNELVKIETVKKAGSDTVIATNNSRMPVMVTLQLSSSSNLASSRNWPIQVQLAGGQSMELVEVSAANKQFGYTFYYSSQFVQGDAWARHDAGVSYRIPFLAGQAFQILQSADGPLFTHTTVATRYAVDINMPVGTTVIAARAGIVVEVVRQFADNGKAEAEFFDKANYVRVLHDDGSWADYVHLMQNSTQVQPGQRVEVGNLLGLSGNSGFSTTPHLHFHVQVNQNGTIISLPFRFRNAHDGVFTPLYQTWLIPDAQNLTASKTKTRKTLRECLPTGKAIDDAVIRCLSS
ncbi:M23 family metallopeptidase [Undibacterium sp. Ji50W]|uniref:M23 family metallopeptidase n=1 Tax=Undibacterium sp. Ji50W TaxID=3413041 RepID=UPI003BF1F349